MAETETINKVFEGINTEVQKSVLDAVEFYVREKTDSGNKIDDMVKANKLRNAYNTLVSCLINERMNKLNRHQLLFLNTGAIADKVEINGKVIELLDTEVYNWLLENFDKKEESQFANVVVPVLEKWKLIAEGKLDLIDTTGKKKRGKEAKIDPQKLKATLEWQRNDAVKAGANISRTVIPLIEKISGIDPNRLKSFKMNFEILNVYFNLLQKGQKISPEEKKNKDAFAGKADAIAKVLIDFTKLYTEIFNRTHDALVSFKQKIDEIKDKDMELAKVSTMVSSEENVTVDSYTKDHLDLIKRDKVIVDTIVVGASEKSPNRVPFSGSRILINAHIPDITKANENYIATPQKIIESLKKILSIHVNAFPKDVDGNFIIPPILIEPIRNFVDFFDDRFIMGIVSGEPGKKGAKVSFTPVDFQVMKAVGLYLAKDSIYNYRGEINEGTFMGDYTGKMEKSAQVKWTGEQKKMNLVMSAELVDAASREDAVQNYMDFVFNAINGLGTPPKMSKRKINVMLRYVTIYSIENNVKLLLQYVAQSEPTEVRDTILKYTNRNYDVAKNMVRKIVREDQIVQRVLGTNPEHVIARIFV